jgi:peptide/nickel transport system substrate-binding protein
VKKLRWQLLIALGGLILIAGLLFGQTPGVEVAAPQPVRGGIYVEADVGTPVRLNPVLDSYNQIDRDLDRLIYSGLIRFDSRGLPKADLAASWTISADGKSYTFALRPDASWHDGQPVSSDDVVYTFSKLQDPDYPGPADLHEMWKQIKVEKVDDRSVQFTLPEPYAPFLDYLSLGLLPEHLLRGVSAKALIDHPYNLHPIGTGPFRFDRFVTDGTRITAISLTAFDKYYGDHPYLQGVEIRFYTDPKAALEAFQAGQVQGLGRASDAELPPLLQDPKIATYSARLPSAGIVFLNLKNPEKTFLADKQIRQALLLSVNRQALIDRFLGGQASVAVGPILPGSWAFAAGLEPTRYDPDRAANQLTAAGYVLPAGAAPGSPEYVRSKAKVTLAFELAHPDDPLHTAVAKAIQANWALIGVQVTLKPVSADSLLKEVLEPRQYEAALTDLNLSRYPDPDPYPFWHDSQVDTGQNYSGFVDRNTSIWLEEARTNPDINQRAGLYRSFQHRFMDQVPSLLLYYPVYTFAVDAQVQGITVGPMVDPSDRFESIGRWYLIVRRAGAAGSTTPTP